MRWPEPNLTPVLNAIAGVSKQLTAIQKTLTAQGVIMSDVNANQTHLDTDITALTANFATVIAELKAQAAAGAPLDFTAADALVASEAAEATADAPPAPAPAPPANPPAS